MLKLEFQNGLFTYYKSNNAPISKIDRSVSNYYEKAIAHFESLDQDVYSSIPENWKFGFQYFPVKNPLSIDYDRLPKNNLVITDIVVKNPKGKNTEVITDKDRLTEWADLLNVDLPPVLFEGKLNEQQKKKILDYLNTPFEQLEQTYKTENFTKWFLTIINPSLKETFLRNGIESTIEGLIFRFNDKIILKLSEPQEYKKASEVKADNTNSDIYNLVLISIGEFLQMLDFNKISIKGNSLEDRYIEFISKAFNKFCKSEQYKENFAEGFYFSLPQYMTKVEAVENFKFVNNNETKELLSKSSTNRELFKIMLSAFRSRKRKVGGLLTNEVMTHHNKLVDKIIEYITIQQQSIGGIASLNEHEVTLLDFQSVLLEEFGEEREVGLSSDEIQEIIGNIDNKVVDHYNKTTNKLFKKSVNELPKVCLVKGSFFPFHNGHLANIKDAAAETGMKCFLAIPKNSVNPNFSKELVNEMMSDVLKEHGNIITGYKVFNTQFPKDLEQYQIGAVCSDDAFYKQYKKLNPDIVKVSKTDQLDSKMVLETVLTDKQGEFNKLVPKHIQKFYYRIKSDLVK